MNSSLLEEVVIGPLEGFIFGLESLYLNYRPEENPGVIITFKCHRVFIMNITVVDIKVEHAKGVNRSHNYEE